MDPIPMTRRQFLGSTAAGAALVTAGLGGRIAPAAEDVGLPKHAPAKIYKIYLGRTGD